MSDFKEKYDCPVCGEIEVDAFYDDKNYVWEKIVDHLENHLKIDHESYYCNKCEIQFDKDDFINHKCEKRINCLGE